MINLEKYLEAQRQEIDRFIWCMGVELGRDPRAIYSESELGCMWVTLYAGRFAEAHRGEYEHNSN
jgi:hypothetical protein